MFSTFETDEANHDDNQRHWKESSGRWRDGDGVGGDCVGGDSVGGDGLGSDGVGNCIW